MQIIPLQGNKAVAIGLKWMSSAGSDVSDLAADQEKKPQGYVHLKNEVSEVTGFASIAPKKGKQLYSFAALCAEKARQEQSRNAFFLFRHPDPTQFVLAGIIDGLPIQDYDRIGALDDLVHLIDKLVRDTGASFTLYTDIQGFDLIQDIQATPLSTLAVNSLVNTKDVASACLVRKINEGGSPLAALLWLAVILAAAWYGWDWYEADQREQMLAAAQANQKPPQQVYEESLPAAIGSAGWDFRSINGVLSAIQSLDLARGGWSVSKIECRFAAKNCKINWDKKRPSATFATLMASFGNEKVPLDFARGTVTQNIPVTATVAPLFQLDSLKPPAHFYGGVISNLQRLAATGDASLAITDPAPFGNPPQGTLKAAYLGSVSLKDARIYLLPMVLSIAPDYLTVSALDLSFDDDKGGSFSIDINYFTAKP